MATRKRAAKSAAAGQQQDGQESANDQQAARDAAAQSRASGGEKQDAPPVSSAVGAGDPTPVVRAGLRSSASPADEGKAGAGTSAGKSGAKPRTMFLEQAYTFNGQIYGPSLADDHEVEVPHDFPEAAALPKGAEPFVPFEMGAPTDDAAADAGDEEDEEAAKRRRARARRRAAGGR